MSAHFGRRTKRRSHVLYFVDRPIRYRPFKDLDDEMLVELRGTKADGSLGLQTMVPPSIHPGDGESLAWESTDFKSLSATDVERRATLAVMESCTGGLLASTLTDVPGSTGYFLGGFVTYATDMKIEEGVDSGVIEEFGAYVVIAPGLALAHARPGPDVRREGLSVVTLARPVAFGHPHNDPVRVVLGVAVATPAEHVAFVAALANVFNDPRAVACVAAATSPDEVRAVLEARAEEVPT